APGQAVADDGVPQADPGPRPPGDARDIPAREGGNIREDRAPTTRRKEGSAEVVRYRDVVDTRTAAGHVEARRRGAAAGVLTYPEVAEGRSAALDGDRRGHPRRPGLGEGESVEDAGRVDVLGEDDLLPPLPLLDPPGEDRLVRPPPPLLARGLRAVEAPVDRLSAPHPE